MPAVLVPQAYTCTPSSLVGSNPCINCLSEKQMLAVLVGIIAIANGKTVAQVMADSACYACLSKKQMLQALVTIAGNNQLGENTTPQEVIDEMHCLICADEKHLLAALLYLTCNYDVISNIA